MYTYMYLVPRSLPILIFNVTPRKKNWELPGGYIIRLVSNLLTIVHVHEQEEYLYTCIVLMLAMSAHPQV